MIIARHTVDRAIVFDQGEPSAGKLFPVAHIPLLGQDRRQLGHLIGAAFTGQARRVLLGQIATALGEELVYRCLPTLLRDKRQRVHQQPVVAAREQRLGGGRERIQMAGTPDTAPYGWSMHETVALKQHDVLPHTDRADAERLAQFGSSHLAAPPEEIKDLVARLPLLAMFGCHKRFLPARADRVCSRRHEYSTRVLALSRKYFQNPWNSMHDSGCAASFLR